MNDKTVMTMLRQFIMLFRDKPALTQLRLEEPKQFSGTEEELELYMHGYKHAIQDAIEIITKAMGEGKK
jgi:hypothetical protein